MIYTDEEINLFLMSDETMPLRKLLLISHKQDHMQHISVRFIIKVRLEYFWNVNVFMELWVIDIFVVRWKWIFIY